MRVWGEAQRPRAYDGRAPDVFRSGRWVPMRCHALDDEVDFCIVGTGAGGGTLACKLAEYGFSVVALEAGHTGAHDAAPIARKLLDTWVKDDDNPGVVAGASP